MRPDRPPRCDRPSATAARPPERCLRPPRNCRACDTRCRTTGLVPRRTPPSLDRGQPTRHRQQPPSNPSTNGMRRAVEFTWIEVTGDAVLLTQQCVDAPTTRLPELLAQGAHVVKGKAAPVRAFGPNHEHIRLVPAVNTFGVCAVH